MTESTHWKLSVLAAGASVAACTSTGRALRVTPSRDAQRAIADQRSTNRTLVSPSQPSAFVSFVFFFFLIRRLARLVFNLKIRKFLSVTSGCFKTNERTNTKDFVILVKCLVNGSLE